MRRLIRTILILSLAAIPAFAQTTATTATHNKSAEEILKEIRVESQGVKSDILAKNLTLSADQAAAFWPLYKAYQKEQDAIIDAQLQGIKQFVEKYDSLDDNAALTLLNAHFERDTKMVALRKKWLPEFQKALGTKLAVRVMQIDRRLSLAAQFEIARLIPLSH